MLRGSEVVSSLLSQTASMLYLQLCSLAGVVIRTSPNKYTQRQTQALPPHGRPAVCSSQDDCAHQKEDRQNTDAQSPLARPCTLLKQNSLGTSVGHSDAWVDAAQRALVLAAVEDEEPEVRDLVDQHGDSQGHIHLQQQQHQTLAARRAQQEPHLAANESRHTTFRGAPCGCAWSRLGKPSLARTVTMQGRQLAQHKGPAAAAAAMGCVVN